MSSLKNALERGQFAVTAELAPPKGCDFAQKLDDAEALRGKVHGLNVTDMQSACLKASSLGFCVALKAQGHEPILQLTGRDRNRMALMGDLLSAAGFGIDTVLALTGDHPLVGDCRDSLPVYDLDSCGILRMISEMEQSGCDCGGNALEGAAPVFYKGASVTPVYEPMALQVAKLKKKVDCGAQYIQTQGIFDIAALRRFMDAVEKANIRTHIMCGVIPLKSANMARYMNENVPGIAVPEEMIVRLEAAAEEGRARGVKGLAAAAGMEMAAELIRAVRDEGLCDGVHIMAIGAERNVPKILEMAGVSV